MVAVRAVVLPLELYRPHPAPRLPDDRDGLFERFDGLTGCAARATHRFDPVPERTGTETELEPAAAEDVEA